jgi:hypothetical protein
LKRKRKYNTEASRGGLDLEEEDGEGWGGDFDAMERGNGGEDFRDPIRKWGIGSNPIHADSIAIVRTEKGFFFSSMCEFGGWVESWNPNFWKC